MIHQRIIDASHAPQNAYVHNPFGSADPREIIEKLRVQRGFASERALAIAAGVPQPTLNRYLSRKSDTMEVASFVALARVLDVTPSELLGEVPLSSRMEVRELVRIMDALDEPQREALIAAGKAMAAAARPRKGN